jgi:hypothetical protein
MVVQFAHRVFRAVSGGFSLTAGCVKTGRAVRRIAFFVQCPGGLTPPAGCVENSWRLLREKWPCRSPHRVFRAVSGGSHAACRLREKFLAPVA